MKHNKIILIGLLSTLLMACGGDKEKEDNSDGVDNTVVTTACDDINNTVYVTDSLEEGVGSMHWRVDFVDGVMTMYQSDFVLTAKYSCDGQTVVADLGDKGSQQLNFERHNIALYFNPLGGQEKTYTRVTESLINECDLVAGKRYVEPSKQKIISAPIEFGPIFYEFSSGQQVDFSIGGDVLTRGVYDCAMGQLHVHTDVSDIKPQIVQVAKDGKTIFVNTGGVASLELVVDEVPVVCTQEYAPVCAADLGSIQCIKAPCADGQYKTYSNRCVADGNKALFLMDGECGDLEGQLYEKPAIDPVICTANYDPVCAVKLDTIKCITQPCPIGSYKTYSNLCTAEADKSLIMMKGECGKLEDQPYEKEPPEVDPVACTEQYSPVCAIELGTIQCITEPCAIGSYKTYSNLCFANMAKSLVMSKGECGDLEGQPYEKPVESPTICTKEYMPVCAAELGTIQCFTTPCPAGQYKTYSNRCLADGAKAKFIMDEACGELEGQFYDEPKP